MSKKDHLTPALGRKAMEMVMRDVLDGMEDLATIKSFETADNVFEILAITPEHKDGTEDLPTGKNAEILQFKKVSSP